MPKKSIASFSGFTLIEVLIALIIVSIALIAVVKANHINIQGQSRLEDHVYASWLADNTLAQYQLGLITQDMTNKKSMMWGQVFFISASLKATEIPNVLHVDIQVENAQKESIFKQSGYTGSLK